MEFNRQETPEDKSTPCPHPHTGVHFVSVPFPCTFPPEQGLTPVTPSPRGCEGQCGSWRKGQRGGREPTIPAATRGWGGGSSGRLPASPSVPASGFLRKNSLFSASIQAPDWDLWVGEGRTGWGGAGGGAGGGSLLPLSLSCLGSPLAPNLHRLLATEVEILARAGGGGRAGCPKL